MTTQTTTSLRERLSKDVDSADAREELEILCDDLTEYGRDINEEQLTGVMRGLHSAEYAEHGGHIDLDDTWIKVYWVFDHLEGLGFTRESLEKLWRKGLPSFMAVRAEVEAALAKPKTPAQPKDDRPTIYRKIDKAVADMPVTIDALSLNTAINKLVLTGDLDRNAQGELAKGIARKTNLTIHQAKDEIKHSIKTTKQANSKGKKRDKNAKPEIDNDLGYNLAVEMAHKVMTDQCDAPDLFHNGGRLVDIRRDETGDIRIEGIDKDRFKAKMDKRIAWTKEGMNVASSSMVANGVYHEPFEDYSALRRITSAPTYTADGVLVVQPGYHAESALFYETKPGVNIPAVSEVPTEAEVIGARETLVDLFADFPLDGYTRKELLARVSEGLDVASFCHVLSVALTPIVRDMISGPCPNHLARKDQPRTGATKIMGVASYIGTLEYATPQTLPDNPAEIQKTLIATVDAGKPYGFFDNLKPGETESDELAAVVTAYPKFTGRRLGQTAMVTVTVNQVWLTTGNRTQLSRQLVERTLMIDLDPKMENPGERPTSSFEYNLDSHVPANAGKYMHALLVLVQNWIANECPEWKGQALGGFENHAKVIGGILGEAGIKGFMQNREKLKSSVEADNPEHELLDALIVEHHKGRDGTVFRSWSDDAISNEYNNDDGERVPCEFAKCRVVAIRDILNAHSIALPKWGYNTDEDGNAVYPDKAKKTVGQRLSAMVGTVREWGDTHTDDKHHEGRYVLTKVRSDKHGVIYRLEHLEHIQMTKK